MSMTLLMGIDVGTSSVKVVIMNTDGEIICQTGEGYSIMTPFPGYAEQAPSVWWQACVQAIQSCLQSIKIKEADIAAISFSGQMHSTVILDANRQVIRDAILHCDQRSMVQADRIRALIGKEYIYDQLLNPIFPGFQLVTLEWIKENEPGNFDRIYTVLSPKDYIRYMLTGRLSTEHSDASATLAYDIRNGGWNHALLRKLDLPSSVFPECTTGTEIVGHVTRQASKMTGLREGIAVVAGGSDQVMQSIGNGVVTPGDATVNIGTSGQVFFPTNEPVANPLLNTNTFCGLEQGSWYTMGAMLSAGVCLKWLKELLFGHQPNQFKELDALVSRVPPGSNGLVFLPYLNGERTPHLNTDAKGMFIGLTLDKGRGEVIRAVMEGVSYALFQCLQTCEALGLRPDRLIASGGAARSKDWLQMQADIYGLPLYTNNVSEHAAVGAAITAGVGTGVYASIREGCRNTIRLHTEPVLPNEKNSEVYRRYYELFIKAYIANRDIFTELSFIEERR